METWDRNSGGRKPIALRSPLFGVNPLRHHAPTDAPTIDLNETIAAERAVVRALVDYIELQGQRDAFVVAFLNWLWVTRDGKKMMSEYESLPKNLKRIRK